MGHIVSGHSVEPVCRPQVPFKEVIPGYRFIKRIEKRNKEKIVL